MVEISAPQGYLLDSTPVLFEITDDREDQTIRVVRSVEHAENKRQKAELVFDKEGRTYVYDVSEKKYVSVGKPLPDAVLGIYADEPVFSGRGELLVEEGELIEVVKSDEQGHCRTSVEYPFGYSFYVKELSAPAGYVRSQELYPISTEIPDGSKNEETITYTLEGPIVNEVSRTNLKVVKTAVDTSLPMEGVEFEIYTKEGQLVEKLVTNKDGQAISSTAFPLEEELILKETKTDAMYATSEDRAVKITKLQEKTGIYACQVETVVNYRFSEIVVRKICGDGSKTPMDGVSFQVWKKGAEGKPDVLIEEKSTDEKGEARFVLGAGEYYFLETGVGKWENFRINEDPIFFSCGKDGKDLRFEVMDMPTETIAEKRSAANGDLLGMCGVSVRDESGTTLSFLWNAELKGYLVCEAGTEGAVTVLYTNNDKDSGQFGMVSILGLRAGNYEIFEVEAPEGYRNDSAVMGVTVGNTGVLGVTRLYDSMKTSEVDTLLGTVACGLCGISALGLFLLAFVEIKERIRRRQGDR